VQARGRSNEWIYKIRMKGHLDGCWSEWFDGLEITNLDNGETMLYGNVVDQAALHGVLAKVRDLRLPLIAVTGDINTKGLRRQGDSYGDDAYRDSEVALNVDVQGGVGRINLEEV
jgi:hypothetical protein